MARIYVLLSIGNAAAQMPVAGNGLVNAPKALLRMGCVFQVEI